MKTLITMILIMTTLGSFSLADWEAQDVGFPENMQVAAYSAVDENIIWAVGGKTGLDNPPFQGISRSTDGGGNWAFSTINADGLDLTEYITVDVFALSDSIAWALLANDIVVPHRGRVLKTIDAGDTWVHQSDAYPDIAGLHNGPDFIHFFDENDGITAGDLEEMYITSDGGESWSKVPDSNYPPILDNEDPYNGSYCTAGESSLWFGSNSGRVFGTSDRGNTWIATDVGLGTDFIWASFEDEMTGLATAFMNTQVSRTTDGGATWTILEHQLPTNAILSYVVGTESTYMYGSASIPDFLGTDPGTGFTSDYFASTFDNTSLSLLPARWANAETGWAGAMDNNIYKWVVEPTGVDEPYQRPTLMQLSQNFPNPFNPTTSIQYRLETAGHVSLDIFNLQGALIASLVDSPKSEGSHRISFDASQMTSGTYIYRLSSKGESISHKMLLLK